ncbi:nucleotidyltransferase domain-containing protein [Pseudomonas putida]|uniref:nucleotidyltransferase domain-containing protein n=1 Tax=Pseudomonas putida TaxID=303 RepID=UPI001CC98949|nr:nucleotidyltransferase domain-containing protein [Pseudomonas putida]
MLRSIGPVACGFVDVRIFGSVCRGEDSEGSDLDLLVTIPVERAGQKQSSGVPATAHWACITPASRFSVLPFRFSLLSVADFWS